MNIYKSREEINDKIKKNHGQSMNMTHTQTREMENKYRSSIDRT